MQVLGEAAFDIPYADFDLDALQHSVKFARQHSEFSRLIIGYWMTKGGVQTSGLITSCGQARSLKFGHIDGAQEKDSIHLVLLAAICDYGELEKFLEESENTDYKKLRFLFSMDFLAYRTAQEEQKNRGGGYVPSTRPRNRRRYR